jgi:hypothetical protein
MDLSRVLQKERAYRRLESITLFHDSKGFWLVAITRNLPLDSGATGEIVVQALSKSTGIIRKCAFID